MATQTAATIIANGTLHAQFHTAVPYAALAAVHALGPCAVIVVLDAGQGEHGGVVRARVRPFAGVPPANLFTAACATPPQLTGVDSAVQCAPATAGGAEFGIEAAAGICQALSPAAAAAGGLLPITALVWEGGAGNNFITARMRQCVCVIISLRCRWPPPPPRPLRHYHRHPPRCGRRLPAHLPNPDPLA